MKSYSNFDSISGKGYVKIIRLLREEMKRNYEVDFKARTGERLNRVAVALAAAIKDTEGAYKSSCCGDSLDLEVVRRNGAQIVQNAYHLMGEDERIEMGEVPEHQRHRKSTAFY